MRFYLDLIRQVDATENTRQVIFGLVDRAQAVIDGLGDWAPVFDVELDRLVNDMARQLPRDDVDQFLSHVVFGFRSRKLEAGLTGGVLRADLGPGGRSTVRLRIRVFTIPELEARLPTVGLDLANLLLRDLPDVRVGAMIIWKERQRKPVLEGAIRERLGMWGAIKASASSSFVLAFSLLALGVLGVGVLVQLTTPNH